MTPGQYLKYCRNHAKVTQKTLSLALGVTQQLISHWESDRQPIPPHQIGAMSHYTGLDQATMREFMVEFYRESLETENKVSCS